MTQAIGILGGAFDPVHFAHLGIALEIYQSLHLKQIRFIPCQTPVHKPATQASAKQRLELLKLATAAQKEFIVDPRELLRDTPSYMVETLSSLRKEFPDTPLCLILGTDAFKDFPTWREPEKILELAHLIIAERPGYPLTQSAMLQQRQTQHAKDLHATLAGKIFVHTGSKLDISSTAIRKMIAEGKSAHHLMPENVWEKIQQEKIYK
jgi:nicotinate-nucleotide adenylyltransferase